MNSENFVYWLKGFMEISRPSSLNSTQVQEIKNHIKLVKGDLVEYYKNPATHGADKGGTVKAEPTYCSSIKDFSELKAESPISYQFISC